MKIIIILIILLIGSFLRIVAIKWGLPVNEHLYYPIGSAHPDEHEVLFAIFSNKEWRNSWFYYNPHFYAWGTFYTYCVTLAIKVAEFFNLCQLNDKTIFGNLYGPITVIVPELYIIGRVVSIIFGILTVYVIYLAGKVFYNAKVGIISAAILSIIPLHVINSYYLRPDSLQVFLITLSLYCLGKYLKKNKAGYYYTGSVTSGLAIATKYDAIFLLGVLLFAPFIKEKKRIALKRIFYMIFFVFLGVLIGGPYFLLAYKEAIEQIRATAALTIRATTSYAEFKKFPLLYLFSYSLPYTAGLPLALLFTIAPILTLFVIIKRIIKNKNNKLNLKDIKDKSNILIFSYIIIELIFLCINPVRMTRYYLPVLPAFVLLSANIISLSLEKARKKTLKKLLLLVYIFSFMFTFYLVGAYINLMLRDVREEAANWIRNNIKPFSSLGFIYGKSGVPLLSPKEYKIIILKHDLEECLYKTPPDYFILSDYEYREVNLFYSHFPDSFLFETIRKEYYLLKKFEKYPTLFGISLPKGFPPHDWMYFYPTILLFKLNKN